MKKIVVIGGTGMLGQPVVQELAKNNFKVYALSRKPYCKFGSLDNIEFVKGNINDQSLLNNLFRDCFGVHINLKNEAEKNIQSIINAAKLNKVQLITYISGNSVCRANAALYPEINTKYANENGIKSSGLPFIIFKPAWFMESLPLFVINDRATYFGKQNSPIPFIAAIDYAKMVTEAYKNKLLINRSYSISGPDTFTFQQAIDIYLKVKHPKIKRASSMPYWIANLIATLSKNPSMKSFVAFMKYFENAKTGPFEHEIALNGKTSLHHWLNN